MRRAGLIAGMLGALTLVPVARADTDIDYRGLRVPVPAGWRVYRLGPDSTECLRYDRHAIYLGQAGANQLCPAHAVDRTEAIHIEPLGEQARSLASGLLHGAGAVVDAAADRPVHVRRPQVAGPSVGPAAAVRPPVEESADGHPRALTIRDRAKHEVTMVLPDEGALITGSYGADPRVLDTVLAGIGSAPVPTVTSAERRAATPTTHRWVTGYGFDTCATPSLEAMAAWRPDFVAANIYIGGPGRSCPDGRLSRDWVAAVRAMGWRLIPTYVGPQAPCSGRHIVFDPDTAALAGEVSAEDAAQRARALGLGRHTPIYLDIEAYGQRDPLCRQAVLDFVDAWTKALRRYAYTPGVYGSAGSGIRDIARATGIAKPSVVWFGHWDKDPDPHADQYVPEEWWPGHRRIKQYRGGHTETHGGYTLNIDNDAVDGYVH